MIGLSRTFRDLSTVVLIGSLLAGVYLLPADTSLSEVEDRGVIGVCIPASYPPLVTDDPDRPGLDVELLKAVARSIGVAIQWHTVPAMGHDFNPRAWRVTRAQCQIVAGGVVDTPTTRSFLDVTQAHAETGWVEIAASAGETPTANLAGMSVGVLVGTSGIDRLALSRFLRNRNVKVTVVHGPDALAAGLTDGRFERAIAESLTGKRIAADHKWSISWLPGFASRYSLVFGLWKGDLTLKRAVDEALSALDEDGTTDEIRRKYLGHGVPSPSDAT